MQYRIKPIEWATLSDGTQAYRHPFGTMFVSRGVLTFSPNGRMARHETDDAAKLAAESLYHSRLLEALEPVEEGKHE